MHDRSSNVETAPVQLRRFLVGQTDTQFDDHRRTDKTLGGQGVNSNNTRQYRKFTIENVEFHDNILGRRRGDESGDELG